MTPDEVNAMQLTAVLIPAEEGGFVAFNPETGTTTQGESIEEALSNLQEATEALLGRISSDILRQALADHF